MEKIPAKDRIIVALDVPSAQQAIPLVKSLAQHVGGFKLGYEFLIGTLRSMLFPDCPVDSGDDAESEQAIENLKRARELFYLLGSGTSLIDIKLDDIPNTTEGVVKQIAKFNRPWAFNIHTSSGIEPVKAAVENRGQCLVFGVTVLTTIKADECKAIFGAERGPKVVEFAEMLIQAGADGVICSPREGQSLRDDPKFNNLKIACPNTRPAWMPKKGDDQDPETSLTPAQAVEAGIDYVIMGRPIRKPPEEIGGPIQAAQMIAQEIKDALG
ncbi:orotidine 5'-phosphate decarboxylase [Candidatus Woesearchaeota archaeon]|nr:orotidine 5'-phosphate decarboxylase [Candidatus Woesearchaeota archaeon]